MIAGLFLFLATPANAEWAKGMRFPLSAACKTEEAVRAIANADMQSNAKAEAVLQELMKARVCVVFGRIVGWVVVSEVLGRYRDYAGDSTAILRGVSPHAPGQNFYFLAVDSLAKQINKIKA